MVAHHRDIPVAINTTQHESRQSPCAHSNSRLRQKQVTDRVFHPHEVKQWMLNASCQDWVLWQELHIVKSAPEHHFERIYAKYCLDAYYSFTSCHTLCIPQSETLLCAWQTNAVTCAPSSTNFVPCNGSKRKQKCTNVKSLDLENPKLWGPETLDAQGWRKTHPCEAILAVKTGPEAGSLVSLASMKPASMAHQMAPSSGVPCLLISTAVDAAARHSPTCLQTPFTAGTAVTMLTVFYLLPFSKSCIDIAP